MDPKASVLPTTPQRLDIVMSSTYLALLISKSKSFVNNLKSFGPAIGVPAFDLSTVEFLLTIETNYSWYCKKNQWPDRDMGRKVKVKNVYSNTLWLMKSKALDKSKNKIRKSLLELSDALNNLSVNLINTWVVELFTATKLIWLWWCSGDIRNDWWLWWSTTCWLQGLREDSFNQLWASVPVEEITSQRCKYTGLSSGNLTHSLIFICIICFIDIN